MATAYKKEGNCSGRSRVRRILLTCIQMLFLQVIWSMPKNLAFFQKPLDNFFINSTNSRSIVKKYSLQVLRTLKTGKAFKQGLKYSQFSPQILCLQASVLIILWHCFQVLYTRAHLAKRKNLHQKGPSVKYPGYANYWVKRLVIHYITSEQLFVRASVMIIKYCILHDEP